MYVRPPSYRYQAPMRVPENYSGNTFREEPEAVPPEPVAEPESEVETVALANEESAAKPALLSQKGFSLRLGSLFGRDRGIGTEAEHRIIVYPHKFFRPSWNIRLAAFHITKV